MKWAITGLTVAVFLAIGSSGTTAQETDKRAIGENGLPVPRFVSISSDKANMRVGPETSYPVRWTYTARGLPVEVIAEHGRWRKVRDMDGEEGWIHVRLLHNNRTAIILPAEAWLYEDPDSASKITVKAAQNARGSITECQPRWCEIDFGTGKGWVERQHIWGVYDFEVWD